MTLIDSRLAKAYLLAKKYVISKGFASEIDWQDSISFDCLTPQVFLKEYSWVVLASGMSDKVISKIFPAIEEKFGYWNDLRFVEQNRDRIIEECLTLFNNKGKIAAIASSTGYIQKYGIEYVKSAALRMGLDYLKTFPFIGEATCFHLAKNIGFNYAKPDRHLVRVSKSMGYHNPNELCEAISNYVEDKVQVVDLVIWRYATLDRNYLDKIKKLTFTS